MLRTTIKLVLVVVILTATAATFLTHRLRSGPGLPSGTVRIEGLSQPVEILYDSLGVPHIFAASLEDVLLAQGWVHARSRLWQMESFRRVIQGRLSEILGPSMVESDRFLRTIGMEKAAREGAPSPGDPMLALSEAYVRGVNAAIEDWRGLLPPEFVLLRLRPEPWSAVLCQGIEKMMAWDLSDYQSGLNLAAAREELGDSALGPLLPRYPEWGVTIVEGWPESADGGTGAAGASTGGGSTIGDAGAAVAGTGRAEPDPPAHTARHSPRASAAGAPSLPPPVPAELLARASLRPETRRWLEMGSITIASNSWVVGGTRSESGMPLLANDMHLGLEAPNIWFLVGLHAPGIDVVGMSIPGAPGVIAGHSTHVAWGFTNAGVDDSDFFIERVNPDNPDEYLTPDGWVPFERREETIRVKGADPVTFTVRSTRHGPVITPVEERAGEQILAFQWIAHAPARTFQAVLGMDQARDADEFLEALRDFDNPQQNVVFADSRGSWGYWLGGRIPLRASGHPSLLPVPGWTGEHDWIGWVDFDEHPHVIAPARGYVATANNAQGRDAAALRVSDGNWASPYRAQRISELLDLRPRFGAEDMLAIQMDAGSALVDRYLEDAVAAFRSAGLEELATRLEGWDRRADLESTEATLFHVWWRLLRQGYMRHYYQGASGYFPGSLLEEALDGERELPIELPIEAARSAAEFADLPWGEAHQLTLAHPMASVPVVGGLLGFGRSGIPREGGPQSVNVAGFAGVRPPFRVTHGPSQRHVVDMADVDGSGGFILPGGQSGWPAGDHSFDQLERWRAGTLWLLPLARERVEERTVAIVRMQPGGP